MRGIGLTEPPIIGGGRVVAPLAPPVPASLTLVAGSSNLLSYATLDSDPINSSMETLLRGPLRPRPTIGPNSKKPAKNLC